MSERDTLSIPADDPVLRDLARAKATFQLRGIVAAMGVNPSTVHFVSPPCQSWTPAHAVGELITSSLRTLNRLGRRRLWVRPTLTKLRAGTAEGARGRFPDGGHCPQGS